MQRSNINLIQFFLLFSAFYSSDFKGTLCGGNWARLSGNHDPEPPFLGRFGCCPANTFMANPEEDPFSIASNCDTCPYGTLAPSSENGATKCSNKASCATLAACPPKTFINTSNAYCASETCGDVNSADASTCCTVCERNCDVCSDATTCTACDSTFFLKNNDCVQNCGTGYYANTATTPDECAACRTLASTCTSATVDTACIGTVNYLDAADTTCKVCETVADSSARTCNAALAAGVTAVTCNSGFHESGSTGGGDLGCTACQDQTNCATSTPNTCGLTATTKTKCLSVTAPGFFLKVDQVVPKANCNTLSCPTGKRLKSNAVWCAGSTCSAVKHDDTCCEPISFFRAADGAALKAAVLTCLQETPDGSCPLFVLTEDETGKKYGAIGGWNTESVENFQKLFENKNQFTADISKWSTASGIYFTDMCKGATAFNSDVSKWSMVNAIDTRSMFYGCESFNSDVSSWKLDSMISNNYEKMFEGAKSFNHKDLLDDKWKDYNYPSTAGMFAGTCSLDDECGFCGNKNTDGGAVGCGARFQPAKDVSTSCTFCENDGDECCTWTLPKCSGFTCTSGFYHLKNNPAAITCRSMRCTVSECCDLNPTCSALVACPATKFIDSSKGYCATATCGNIHSVDATTCCTSCTACTRMHHTPNTPCTGTSTSNVVTLCTASYIPVGCTLTSDTSILDCSGKITSTSVHLHDVPASVTQIDLSNNQLTECDGNTFAGTSLPGLRVLNMAGNQLTKIPSSLVASHTGLVDVDVSSNQIQGQISGSTFSKHIDLKHLRLAGNELTGFETNAFQSNIHLETLDLKGNSIGSSSLVAMDFKAATRWKTLKTLDLSDNNIVELPAQVFSGLVNVAEISLAGNGLTSIDAAAFTGLSQLKTLDLSGNGLSALPDGTFDSLPMLQELKLNGNSFLNGFTIGEKFDCREVDGGYICTRIPGTTGIAPSSGSSSGSDNGGGSVLVPSNSNSSSSSSNDTPEEDLFLLIIILGSSLLCILLGCFLWCCCPSICGACCCCKRRKRIDTILFWDPKTDMYWVMWAKNEGKVVLPTVETRKSLDKINKNLLRVYNQLVKTPIATDHTTQEYKDLHPILGTVMASYTSVRALASYSTEENLDRAIVFRLKLNNVKGNKKVAFHRGTTITAVPSLKGRGTEQSKTKVVPMPEMNQKEKKEEEDKEEDTEEDTEEKRKKRENTNTKKVTMEPATNKTAEAPTSTENKETAELDGNFDLGGFVDNMPTKKTAEAPTTSTEKKETAELDDDFDLGGFVDNMPDNHFQAEDSATPIQKKVNRPISETSIEENKVFLATVRKKTKAKGKSFFLKLGGKLQKKKLKGLKRKDVGKLILKITGKQPTENEIASLFYDAGCVNMKLMKLDEFSKWCGKANEEDDHHILIMSSDDEKTDVTHVESRLAGDSLAKQRALRRQKSNSREARRKSAVLTSKKTEIDL